MSISLGDEKLPKRLDYIQNDYISVTLVITFEKETI